VTDRRDSWFVVLILATTLVATGACHRRSPTEPTPGGSIPGFTLAGSPSASGGATWTYRIQDAGIAYDLQGILLAPSGSGPFPAVIISHGNNSNVSQYSRTIANVMVGWGLVCIATNYTHAGGVPTGSPGTSSEIGATTANVLRARKMLDILRGLGLVDMNRVALHGHSLGAFVGEATAGAYPSLFRAASHTAGGIRPEFVPDVIPGLAPSEAQIATIRAPYQMHHGERDVIVPVIADQLFDAALRARGVTRELVIYPGAGHDDVRFDPPVLDRIRAWYRSNGVL
jgi:dienelactone hydrolase